MTPPYPAPPPAQYTANGQQMLALIILILQVSGTLTVCACVKHLTCLSHSTGKTMNCLRRYLMHSMEQTLPKKTGHSGRPGYRSWTVWKEMRQQRCNSSTRLPAQHRSSPGFCPENGIKLVCRLSSEKADLGRWGVQDQPGMHNKTEASLGHTRAGEGSMTQRQMDKHSSPRVRMRLGGGGVPFRRDPSSNRRVPVSRTEDSCIVKSVTLSNSLNFSEPQIPRL